MKLFSAPRLPGDQRIFNYSFVDNALRSWPIGLRLALYDDSEYRLLYFV